MLLYKNQQWQDDLDEVIASLPELEDLNELQQLLERAKQLPNDNEKANRAISYAGMVIRYVSDGSGTSDMIERATKQLKEILK